MPNWCDNTLEITHPDIKMMRRFVKAWNRNRVFDEFIPVPEELSITASPATKDEELQKIYAENKEKYGYQHWYDFCVNEWGTKWDVGMGDRGVMLTPDSARRPITVGFDSAWSPPISGYEMLSHLGFSIRAYYFEGGMMYCGKWEDGDSEHYEIEENNSKWVKENIPEDIDDYMGISDCMQLDEECEDA